MVWHMDVELVAAGDADVRKFLHGCVCPAPKGLPMRIYLVVKEPYSLQKLHFVSQCRLLHQECCTAAVISIAPEYVCIHIFP